jgi:hypothetical protein
MPILVLGKQEVNKKFPLFLTLLIRKLVSVKQFRTFETKFGIKAKNKKPTLHNNSCIFTWYHHGCSFTLALQQRVTFVLFNNITMSSSTKEVKSQIYIFSTDVPCMDREDFWLVQYSALHKYSSVTNTLLDALIYSTT